MKKNADGLLLDPILDRVISSLNLKAAEHLLRIKADRKTRARVRRLADKNSEGALSTQERREYELYLMANHFVALLKAKARILLSHSKRPA